MNDKGQNTSVNRSERTEAIDREKTVATPHFDAAAVEKARPAVPLSQLRQGRTWPTGLLIIIAIVAGLAGGIIGGLLPTLYQTEDARQTVVAQQTPAPDTVPGQPPAQTVTAQQPAPAEESAPPVEEEARPKEGGEAMLRSALKSWVAATNARDLDRQMNFYNPVIDAFYQSRNAPRALVRADKARVYRRASSIDITTDEPDIELGPDGSTAVMRFRKRYAIEGGGEDRRGEVLQELRWRLTDGRWRITSERDLQVVR